MRATAADVADSILRHYGQMEWGAGEFAEYVDPDWLAPPLSPDLAAALSDDASPVVLLVNAILSEAFTVVGADAVRITPGPEVASVRCRVGGEWVEREPFPAHLLLPVAGRLAVMAGMDIGPVFDPGFAAVFGPAVGRIPFRVQSASFLARVAIEITPVGPAIDLELVREPEPAA